MYYHQFLEFAKIITKDIKLNTYTYEKICYLVQCDVENLQFKIGSSGNPCNVELKECEKMWNR